MPMNLQAAGMKLVAGTDNRAAAVLDRLYQPHGSRKPRGNRMTPAQVIVAATRDSAQIGKFNTGTRPRPARTPISSSSMQILWKIFPTHGRSTKCFYEDRKWTAPR